MKSQRCLAVCLAPPRWETVKSAYAAGGSVEEVSTAQMAALAELSTPQMGALENDDDAGLKRDRPS